MELAPGIAITDEITLRHPLDAGGMGIVWIGHHARLRREVAIKFITQELLAAEPTALDRFRREAAVLRQVDSEHIVQSYGQGAADDGTPYIVMELLTGKDLASFLMERGSWLTLDEITALVEQLAEALTQFHQFDIVHRDIKAENVLVVGTIPSFEIKVIDFGCAKVPDLPGSAVLTAPGALVGSADYMSPEQIVNAATVDHLADLWGMAVVLYVSLVFELPFKGHELADVFTAIRAGNYARATTLRPELHAAADAFFERAFHPQLAERFLSAADMANAFKEALREMPRSVHSLAPRRDRATLALWLLGALLLIGFVVAMLAF